MGWSLTLALLLQLLAPRLDAADEVTAGDWTVLVTAQTKANPPTVILNWAPNNHSTEYDIFRKRKESENWTPRASIPGSSTGFIDVDVKQGEVWEYKVVRRTNRDYTGHGYILTGIEAPLIDQRGRVLLIVANDTAPRLDFELKRLERDLIGDGWIVARRDVSPTDPVTKVKEVIRSAWAEDKQNTRAVFLFGRVPIPYSGNITPDYHENHKGAWPADVYYGDLDGEWTDSTVTAETAEREINWNLPGDGKFDQSEIPSPVELEVGRVDLRDLTCFANKVPSRDETALLKQYLDKAHNFRHGVFRLPRKAYVIDYIGIKAGQDPVGTALRNFGPLVGPENIRQDWFYFSHLNTEGHLWSWVGSGGSYHYAFGLGSADDFAISDIKAVFTMWLGSYYGDWNHESNFMRASLGSSSHVLTASYSGAPHFMYHHMGLGETIGYGVRLSQNNTTNGLYPPVAQGINQVHISLLGDPTLRMHPVLPPASVSATADGDLVRVQWERSPDRDVIGYHVYRVGSQIERITSGPTITSEVRDTPAPGTHTYMVRAVKLETSPSGTYYNASQGVFTTVVTGASPPPVLEAPTASASAAGVTLTLTGEGSFEVQRSAEPNIWADVGQSRSVTWRDSFNEPGAKVQYRARQIVNGFASPWSAPVSVELPRIAQARATFVAEDSKTQGFWEGNYGTDGWNLGQFGQKRPGYFQLASLGANEVFNMFVTNVAGALENPAGEDRLIGGWWGTNHVELDANITDGKVHRLSLYFHDYSRQERRQRVELLDAVTRSVLDTRVVEGFETGKYVSWDVQGRVLIRVASLTEAPALVSAIFLDTPANLPAIRPLPGSYPGAVPIILSTGTEGAELRYTTDGSEPTPDSARFIRPFLLTATGVVKVRAFLNGEPLSGTASSSFLIGERIGGIGFVQEDSGTQGSWSPTYGQEGFFMPGANWSLPFSIEVQSLGGLIYLWNDNTREARALARTAGSQDRVASAWYSSDKFTINVGFADQETHRVALYFLDWDKTGRSQSVRVKNSSGDVIDERTISNFANGKYLVYDLKGHVSVEIKKITGNNAVLNGIFLGPAPKAGGVGFTPLLLDPHWNTGFCATLLGVGGTEFVVEATEDCQTWTPHLTDKFANEPYQFVDKQALTDKRRFYRVRAK